MIPLDLSLTFFALLVVLNYRARRSVLYPPFIFSAVWMIDLVVVRSGLIEVNPIHGNTLAIVAAGAAAFSLGGFLVKFAPQELFRFHIFSLKPARTNASLRNALIVVLLLALPLMIYQIFKLSGSLGGGFNILAQARLALIDAAEEGESNRSAALLSFFTMLATYSSLLFAIEKRDRQFWVVTALALIMCILSTGRANLLLLISGLSGIRLLQTKQESLRGAFHLLRWPIALFVTLYVGLIFTNKNVEGMNGGTSGIATYFILSYIVGPLAAFDNVVQHPMDFAASSNHSFQYFLSVAAKLHLISYTAPPRFDTFVLVPFPTNVYTVFKFYFLELGVAGMATLLFVIGLFHSMLYVKAKHGGRLSGFMFAFSIYPVLMVIFDDVYYTIGGYMHAVEFGLMYFLIGSVPFRLLPRISVKPTSNDKYPDFGAVRPITSR